MKLLNLNVLHNTCNASKSAVTAGYREITQGGRSCWFKDNGATVLAVAHIDHVCQATHFSHCKVGDDLVVYSPRLDDRLGVYTIQHVLPMLGINVDVLLCDDEEKGDSTADIFESDKQYNFMVEFDRMGGDVVTYQYRSKDWEAALKEQKFRIGTGSFSDISSLGHLGCCGVNIGVGYQNYHSVYSHFIVSEWLANLSRFADLYDEYSSWHFKHKEEPRGSSNYWDRNWDSYYYGQTSDDPKQPDSNTLDVDPSVMCPWCEGELAVSYRYPDHYRCRRCGDLIREDEVVPNPDWCDPDLIQGHDDPIVSFP